MQALPAAVAEDANLLRLGRCEDALQSIDQAIELDSSVSDYRRLRREICDRA